MTDKNNTPNLSRRKLLTRFGLAAGAAYVAPVFMQLDAAEARTPRDRPTRPTVPTRPTQPTKPTRPTKPSRPRNRR
jgi:hypothetical protein